MLVNRRNNSSSHTWMMGMQNGTTALENSLATSYKDKLTLTI